MDLYFGTYYTAHTIEERQRSYSHVTTNFNVTATTPVEFILAVINGLPIWVHGDGY